MEDRLIDVERVLDYIEELRYSPFDRDVELDELVELYQFQQVMAHTWYADQFIEHEEIERFRQQLIDSFSR